MNLRIEPAVSGNVSAIVRLMRDFAAYEKLSDYFTLTEEKLQNVMFGSDAFVKGVVGFDGKKAIAYALFYRSFSSFRGQRAYFLEDIYIDQEYRGHGLGRTMLKAVAAAARADGAERLDFLVLNWNEPALRFYRSLGAEPNDDELHFKFTDEAFLSLATR